MMGMDAPLVLDGVLQCRGPVVWYPLEDDGSAVLQCAACGLIVTTGNYWPDDHRSPELLREGMT